MTIYIIVSGEYSDWQVHGYMTDRVEAEKYCALKNQKGGGAWGDDYYVISIDHINADVKDVRIKYYHTVIFDFGEGMRDEPDRYRYYVGEDWEPEIIYNVYGNSGGWIEYGLTCDSRKKAEKIAQDKYYQFMEYKGKFGIEQAAKLMGAKRVRFNR